MLNVMFDFIKNCLLLCAVVGDLDWLGASLSRRGSNPVKAIHWSWHIAAQDQQRRQVESDATNLKRLGRKESKRTNISKCNRPNIMS